MVAVIPPVLVRDRIGVEVPVAVVAVPVAVERARAHLCCLPSGITASKRYRFAVFDSGHKSPLASSTDSLLF